MILFFDSSWRVAGDFTIGGLYNLLLLFFNFQRSTTCRTRSLPQIYVFLIVPGVIKIFDCFFNRRSAEPRPEMFCSRHRAMIVLN